MAPWIEVPQLGVRATHAIFADIKSANRKHQDNKLNRGVQAFLYGLLQVRLTHPRPCSCILSHSIRMILKELIRHQHGHTGAVW